MGEFANHKPNTQDENQGTFRLDQVLGSKDTLSRIYTLLDGFDAGTIGDLVVANSVVPGFGGQGSHIYQHGSITEQHTFSPTLFNEIRVGFNRMDAAYDNQDASQGNAVGAMGLPQSGNFMEPATNGNLGVPSVNIAGLSSIGTANNPQWRADNTVQLSDGLTFVRGNHTERLDSTSLTSSSIPSLSRLAEAASPSTGNTRVGKGTCRMSLPISCSATSIPTPTEMATSEGPEFLYQS